MPKGAGGGTQTVQQNADPWSGAQPYISQGLHNLQQVYQYGQTNPGGSPGELGGGYLNTPAYYPNNTVHGMSPWTTSALEAQYQRGAQGSPVTDAAQGQTVATLQGGYFDNPWLSQAIDYATAPVEAAVNSAFSSAGRYGSGSQVDQLSRNIGEISSNMAFQNYNNERNRQMQAASMAPTLANQDYLDITQAGASGSALDAYNQAVLNADVERWNYGQDADWRRTQDFLATVMGSAPTGSTSVSRTTPNAFSSALGGAMGLAGIGNMLGLFGGSAAGGSALASALAGASMFSDERLKYDIEEVGKLHNGLPLYTYHYIDEPADTPKHFGVMAQEALEVKPEAVGMLHGFLTVNPSKVTEEV